MKQKFVHGFLLICFVAVITSSFPLKWWDSEVTVRATDTGDSGVPPNQVWVWGSKRWRVSSCSSSRWSQVRSPTADVKGTSQGYRDSFLQNLQVLRAPQWGDLREDGWNLPAITPTATKNMTWSRLTRSCLGASTRGKTSATFCCIMTRRTKPSRLASGHVCSSAPSIRLDFIQRKGQRNTLTTTTTTTTITREKWKSELVRDLLFPLFLFSLFLFIC